MITSCASCEGRFGAQSERRCIQGVKNPGRQAELRGRAEKKIRRARYEVRRVVEKPIVRLLAVLSNETFWPRALLLELGFRKHPNRPQMLEDRRLGRDEKYFSAIRCRVENLFERRPLRRRLCRRQICKPLMSLKFSIGVRSVEIGGSG